MVLGARTRYATRFALFCYLLDVRFIHWGLGEAICANNSLFSACVVRYLFLFLALLVMNTFFRELTADDD